MVCFGTIDLMKTNYNVLIKTLILSDTLLILLLLYTVAELGVYFTAILAVVACFVRHRIMQLVATLRHYTAPPVIVNNYCIQLTLRHFYVQHHSVLSLVLTVNRTYFNPFVTAFLLSNLVFNVYAISFLLTVAKRKLPWMEHLVITVICFLQFGAFLLLATPTIVTNQSLGGTIGLLRSLTPRAALCGLPIREKLKFYTHYTLIHDKHDRFGYTIGSLGLASRATVLNVRQKNGHCDKSKQLFRSQRSRLVIYSLSCTDNS